MNIIAVDDEYLALKTLVRTITEVASEAQVKGFEYADEALEYAKENKIDVAFLDIEMPDISGLALAKALKDIYGKTNVIFVTGHSQYLKDAFSLRASGYVLKPIEAQQVKEELENLRNPIVKSDANKKEIRIQCFGNFEIFADDKPIVFSRSKSKEALAYLVDRNGATVTKKELAAILTEKEEYTRGTQSYIHNIIADMISSLEKAGCGDIVIKHRNAFSVDKSKMICDYYEYKEGEINAVNSYHGEYMTNYSWGEFRIGDLSKE